MLASWRRGRGEGTRQGTGAELGERRGSGERVRDWGYHAGRVSPQIRCLGVRCETCTAARAQHSIGPQTSVSARCKSPKQLICLGLFSFGAPCERSGCPLRIRRRAPAHRSHRKFLADRIWRLEGAWGGSLAYSLWPEQVIESGGALATRRLTPSLHLRSSGPAKRRWNICRYLPTDKCRGA